MDLPTAQGFPAEVSIGLPLAKTAAPATEVLLTRSQAARRLGVSLSTVRRMEGAELVPVEVEGKHLFRRTDIDLFVRADEGQLAAEAFAAFESGKTAVGERLSVSSLLQRPTARKSSMKTQAAHLF